MRRLVPLLALFMLLTTSARASDWTPAGRTPLESPAGLDFTERRVNVGEALDGQYPVIAGLSRGELAVTDGAVFLSNILYAPPSD